MSEFLPIYKKPLASIKEPVISEKFWEIAEEKFDNKEYKEAIIAVINYINRDILKKIDKKDDIKISQMHGSIEINIDITNSEFRLYIPFLKIDKNTNVVALLRRVEEVNFSYFDLAYIELNEDKLEISYSAPLDLCKPIKIYNLIKDVTFLADEYANEFIKKYNAKFLKEPKVKHLTQKEQEEVYREIKRVIKEYKDYSLYFKEKQKDAYCWDIGVISLLKLSNMPYLNGYLQYDIIKSIRVMYDGDLDFDYRILKAKEQIDEIANLSKEELLSNLYHTELFTSMLFFSSEDIIKDRLEKSIETLQKYEKDANYFAISYYLQTVFLKLIYNYNLSSVYKREIENCLVKISGKKPKEASSKLIKLFNKLYNKELNSSFLGVFFQKSWNYLYAFSLAIFIAVIALSIFQGLSRW